jgi:hypothetical protein
MGKRSRSSSAARVAVAERPTGTTEIPVVGMREPCPCGSGRRYKACHGRAARSEAVRLVARPFEGLAGEADWVAMREIVPAATATVRTTAEHGGRDVTVTTVLTALSAEPGTPVVPGDLPGPGPRLQDVLEPGQPFEVTVHEGFDYWLAGVDEVTPDVRESLERANSAVVPTRRLASVEAAYWCEIGARRHLRWVIPEAEDQLLDGLARLHAADRLGLVEGSRYVGAFRADGLLVPVWDLAPDTEADELEEPAAAFARLLQDTLAEPAPLTADERRARAGVVSRQLTLR